MIYIVGSGPSGVACANALINQGLEVTMLDGGIDLEPERKDIVETLKCQSKTLWDSLLINRLKENTNISIGGVPLKTIYGSAFPYLDVERYMPIEGRNVACLPTLARGGFSNVWGANVLPYRAEDIQDWPISLQDLIPHYVAVFDFLDLAASKDDLETVFPLYANRYHPITPSRQARQLLNDLEESKEHLEKEGFVFGQSRLAVKTTSSPGARGCVYCGLCLYGCPYGFIYNSSRHLETLCAHSGFRYIKNIVVDKIKETVTGVKIFCDSQSDGKKIEFETSRLYLACGPLATTRILLESFEAYDEKINMKDSQYFLLPCVRYRETLGIDKDEIYTLSQVYVELLCSEISSNTIHLQLYLFNDLYEAAIKRMTRWSHYFFKPLLDRLINRLVLIQGYLHSDVSSSFSVSLRKEMHGKRSTLVLEPVHNLKGTQIIQKVVKKIFRNRKSFKMFPILPALKIAQPGRGFHSGGTFPMKAKPSHFESDVLGRPFGFKRVHIVDSTTFPSIPASTIALTSMANAHRIASAYGDN